MVACNYLLQIVQRTDVGLGEAYMDGDFLVDDLAGFMAIMVANARNLEGQKGLLGVANWVNDKLLAAAHAQRSNTREGEAHMIIPSSTPVIDLACSKLCTPGVCLSVLALTLQCS